MRDPGARPVAHAGPPRVVVGSSQGRWVVSVSLLRGFKTNKQKVFPPPQKKKVWHKSLHLSGCPGFQQQSLVIGTAVFRCWAGRQARRLAAPAIVCHLRIREALPGRKASVM